MYTVVFDCRKPLNAVCISHLVFFCLNCLHSLHDVLSGIFQLLAPQEAIRLQLFSKQYVLKSDKSQSRHVFMLS